MGQNEAGSFSDRDTFGRSDQFAVDLDDHCLGTSQRIFGCLVVIVEFDASYLHHPTQVNPDSVILALVVRDQPHVLVIYRVIDTVD